MLARPRSATTTPSSCAAPRGRASHARLRPHLLGAQVGVAAATRSAIRSSRRGARPPTRAPSSAALGYLEEHAAFLRRGRAGAERVPALGLVAAAFSPPHLARRRPGPSHPRAGRQPGPGRTRAASAPSTARAIYRHAKTAGYLYQAELRHRLRPARWGSSAGAVHQGGGRDRGRPAGGDRRLQPPPGRDRGAHGGARRDAAPRAAQVAALDTRRAKELRRDRASDLYADWAARAHELGFGPREIEARLDSAAGRACRIPARSSACSTELAGPQGLTAHESQLQPPRGVRDAVRARRPGRGPPRWASGRARSLHRIGSCCSAPTGPARGALHHRPSSSRSSASWSGAIAGAPAEGAGPGRGAGRRGGARRRPELSDEQAAMVRGLTGRRRPAGGAGAGRRRQDLRARSGPGGLGGERLPGDRRGARCPGGRRARGGLGDPLGHPGASAHGGPRAPSARRSQAMSVVVLDEAGMVGTRDLAELARHAEDAGAKLVLVGDDAQLPGDRRRRSLPGPARAPGALELAENRRQERALGARGPARHPRGAPGGGGGRLRSPTGESTSARTARRPPRSGWWPTGWPRHRGGGRGALMIAAHPMRTPRTCRARARALRSRPARSAARSAAACRRAVRRRRPGDGAAQRPPALGVQNGMRGVVRRPGGPRRWGRAWMDDSARLSAAGLVPAEAATSTYADAITAHKAQGLTVERAFVLGSGQISREWGYTALSRAREETRLYLRAVGGRALERRNWAAVTCRQATISSKPCPRADPEGGKSLALEAESPGLGREW